MRSHQHQAIVQVVNRTVRPLEVMWDGTPTVIPPGYKLAPVLDDAGQPTLLKDGSPVEHIVGAGANGEPLSKPMLFFAAEAAKRQNPIMGTLDPQHHLTYETLIGIPEWGDDVSHVEQNDLAEELLDRSLLPPERQNVVRQYVPGARKTSSDRERAKRRAMYSQGNQGNPTGMKGSYSGGAEFL